MVTKKEPPNYIHFQIAIRIIAKRIYREKLEEVLQLPASGFVSRGTRWRRSFRKASRDIWVHDIVECYRERLNSGLRKTEKIVGSLASAFVKVRESLKYETELYFSYHSGLASGGFEFPVSLLRALAEAKMKLRVSVFSWGYVITEKKQMRREAIRKDGPVRRRSSNPPRCQNPHTGRLGAERFHRPP
jgi:hypothetical protein